MNKKFHKILAIFFGTIDALCLLTLLIFHILVATKTTIFPRAFSLSLWVILGINLIAALYIFAYILSHKKR